MAASPYFDGCYFDPTYFDAAPCVAPSNVLGRHVRGRHRIPLEPPTEPEDDTALILLITGRR